MEQPLRPVNERKKEEQVPLPSRCVSFARVLTADRLEYACMYVCK